jgi:hypothetical protein
MICCGFIIASDWVISRLEPILDQAVKAKIREYATIEGDPRDD